MRNRNVIIIAGAAVFLIILSLLFARRGEVEQNAPEVSTSSLLKDAELARSQGNLQRAKEKFIQALEDITHPKKIEEIKKTVEDINMEILFSPLLDDCSTEYTVKPKDTLGKIASAHNTTVGLLKRSNHLDSDLIHPGQKLKVTTCPFSLVVDKSQNLLFLKRKGEIIKTYLVATGRENCTPPGTFKITIKLPDPTWFKTGAVIPPDSPDNILGTRWMGFADSGYGIHGTTEPEKLGQQVTSGCVRMKNEEVEELYDVVPVGTEVTIVD